MRRTLIPVALGLGLTAFARSASATVTVSGLQFADALMPQAASVRPPESGAPTGLTLRTTQSLTTIMPKPRAKTPEQIALLDQARLWQSRNRDDLAAEALNRLLTISSEHPDALAQLCFLQLRTNQKSTAKQTLERLRRARPDHPDIGRIATLIRLDEEDKERLRQARMLGRSGRPEEAVAALRTLYPDGPPTGDLALEYWLLMADTRNGWESAYAGLRRLVGDYPDNLRYRLALAEHITIRRPNDPAALKTITELSEQPPLDRPARAAWRRAMLRLGPSSSSVSLIEQYLAHETVEDSAVKEHLANLKQAIERHRKLMADPYYRAQLQGLALIDGGNLEQAESHLQRAAEGRADDSNLLGGLGLLRLRQGHHAEAQAYFQEAAKRDAKRWTGLLRTAQFWGLMREASDAIDTGEYALAENKLRQARTVDAREPAAMNALGRLHAAQGHVEQAETFYRQALGLEFANADAVQGLAILYLRSGREQQIDSLLARLSGDRQHNAAAAIGTAHATMLKEQAQTQLAKGDSTQAAALLERAAEYDRDDPWLRYDLARLYVAKKETARGDALFADLLARRPNDAAARYAHALYLSGQDRRVDALTTLEHVAEQQRDTDMTSLQRRLWAEFIAQRAGELVRDGKPASARRVLSEAERTAGTDPDILLDLAAAWLDIGDLEHGHQLLVHLGENKPPSVEWGLRHARLLASAGGDDMVPPLLDGIAHMSLDPQQRAALDDIRIDLALREIAALRAAGRAAQALAVLTPWLTTHPNNDRLLAAQARTLRALGRREDALAVFDRLSTLRPKDRNIALSRIELLIELRRNADARRLIDAQIADFDDADADQMADLAGSLLDLGDRQGAQRLIDAARERTPDHPRLLAYAGQLAQRDGRIADAIDLLQRSLAAEHAQRTPAVSMLTMSGPAPAPQLTIMPGRDAAATAEPDYAHRRLAELLDAQTTWIAAGVDQRSRSGSNGTSDYSATETVLEWKRPQTRDGRWTLHADIVSVDAGALDLSQSASAFGSALLCDAACNSGIVKQHARGLALNAALVHDNTRYDIGTTPLGFPVQSLVGGILHKGDLGPFSYSIDVSRRPLTGSLLSYAGTRDPRTGLTWGGVRATGVRFGLSLDDGGTIGGWSSLGLHKLTGVNVLTNDRLQLMAGGIFRIINEDDRLLQVGLTGMLWRMSENAGEYTFGHGGYYSPERFTSLSLPVTFGQRYARLSYAVRASVSASRSQTKDAPYFPTDQAMQDEALRRAGTTNITPIYSGGPGHGTGRSLSLAAEYQIDPRLFFGARLELDRSPDYSPNRFAFYLRYALDRQSAKPVNFLPEAVAPVSQY